MRCSGILMHITSLPGPYGIGTMGKQAFEFVDFLESAGQGCWQILPLNPTGYGDSPYQSCSTFAGNHYLIDLDTLIADGLLLPEEVAGIRWNYTDTKADFGLLYDNRLNVLYMAYGRFAGSVDFDRFCEENSSWLPDFGLFMALKFKFGGKPWYQWDRELKFREPEALEKARQELAGEIRFQCFVQYLFFKQWKALRDYAHGKGIRIIGDVPIYVPYDSVDVWTDTYLFQMDENLNPTAVAGCPPDGFSADGQLWGNPLYRWDVLKEQNYAWWIRRLAAAGELYDMVRMDHFRGFESYWSVPFGDATAQNGHWVKGPGMDLINAVKENLPKLAIIAEDLGFLTPEVLQLRDDSGFPGMKVLEFAFDSKEPSNYMPYTYTPNTVCYTGTHDNMTMRQWFDAADPSDIQDAKDYMDITDDADLVWGMIRMAFASVSDLCIVQMQDLLDLGAEARMNFPGTLSDLNWTWRAKDDIINKSLADRVRKLTEIYGRIDG